MNLYKNRSDRGFTTLSDGSLVRKYSRRICAAGAVDELNAHIGMIMAFGSSEAKFRKFMGEVQLDLIQIVEEIGGSEDHLEPERVALLEEKIDEINATLPEFRGRVVPGGTMKAGALHIARQVCRRAERYVCRVAMKEGFNRLVMVYLNRLSDLLMLYARVENVKKNLEKFY